MRWLREFKRPPRKTFVVHGEPDAAAAPARSDRKGVGMECCDSHPQGSDRAELSSRSARYRNWTTADLQSKYRD
jgi:hypothetical protein